MLVRMMLLLVIALVSPGASLAIGPLLSEGGWTPVERSRVVELPQNYQPPVIKPQIEQVDYAPQLQTHLASDRIDIDYSNMGLEQQPPQYPVLEQQHHHQYQQQQQQRLQYQVQKQEHHHYQQQEQQHQYHQPEQPQQSPQHQAEEVVAIPPSTVAPTPVLFITPEQEAEQKEPIIIYPEGSYQEPRPVQQQRPVAPQPLPPPPPHHNSLRPPPPIPQRPHIPGPPPQQPQQQPPRPHPLALQSPLEDPRLVREVALQQQQPQQPQAVSPPVRVPPPPPEQASPGRPLRPHLVRKPRPRPRPWLRPRPRPGNKGSGSGGGILGSLGEAYDKLKCSTKEWATESVLQDKDYMRQQINCVLNKGPCDSNGKQLRRMAPEVVKGFCPPPCDKCMLKQIQKVMAHLSVEYPYEWSLMSARFG